MKRPTGLLCVVLLAACGAKTPEGTFTQSESGVVVTPATGAAKRVRLEVRSDRIVRVTAVADDNLELPPSLMVTQATAAPTEFKVERKADDLVLTTAQTHRARVAGERRGELHGCGARRCSKKMPLRVLGNGVSQRFNPPADEAFYGLGQHQNARMNLNGEDVELAQHNMDIGVPFVVSSRNYGVLWDNNSITRFGDPKPYGLASRDLKIRDAAGKEGGFTARYSLDGAQKLERVEKDINYQYIRDRFSWPKELLGPKEPAPGAPPNILPDQTVTWEGTLESAQAGVHTFQLYASSYFKLYVDGKLVLDRWRQNWNPWYHPFDVPMTAASRRKLRIEWIPNDGYIALLHNDPLPDAERHSLTFTSEAGRAIDYYFVAGANRRTRCIAGYRALTGKSVLLPKMGLRLLAEPPALHARRTSWSTWWPSTASARSRSTTSCSTGSTGRRTPGARTSSTRARFPDPKGMVDEVHAHNAQLMISVWPKFYPTTANYKELDAAGFIYHGNVEVGELDWVGKGYTYAFYDPYSKPAREMYWRQVNEKLNVLGIDAWWMDADRARPAFQSRHRLAQGAHRPDGDWVRRSSSSTRMPLVHSRRRLRRRARRAARQARVHPDALGHRGHPAQRGGGVERRHRFALGRYATTRSRRA